MQDNSDMGQEVKESEMPTHDEMWRYKDLVTWLRALLLFQNSLWANLDRVDAAWGDSSD